MSTRRCRAKDPAQCPMHGKRQLGVRAEANIQRLFGDPKRRYFLSAEERQTKPLKEMNPAGLALTISEFAAATPGVDQGRVDAAILFAANVHRKDFRANRGRYPYTPYIEHPLRNTLRLIRYGCADEAALIGSLLHDVVEDHPLEIARDFGGKATGDEGEARQVAQTYIAAEFGERAAAIVHGMSNPIGVDDLPVAQKNAAYAAHVAEAIEEPLVAVGKVCDLVDNAVGLYHNLNGGAMKTDSIRRKAVKYLAVWDVVEQRVARDQIERRFPVSASGLEHMRRNLAAGRERLEMLAVLPDSDR